MKKYVCIGILAAVALHAVEPINTTTQTLATQPGTDTELSWVDEQIHAILPPRVGVPEGFINSLRDPMKFKKPAPKVSEGSKLLAPPKLQTNAMILAKPKIIEEPLRLLAIMNQSVLISGKWYKVGQSVRNFTLTEIKSNSVLLSGPKDQKLILFLNKQSNQIKIITK
jgi:hypothetical protein